MGISGRTTGGSIRLKKYQIVLCRVWSSLGPLSDHPQFGDKRTHHLDLNSEDHFHCAYTATAQLVNENHRMIGELSGEGFGPVRYHHGAVL